MTKLYSKEKTVKDWRFLEFIVPITEAKKSEENGKFTIRGVAINETTTRNGIHYSAKELSKSASSLVGRPLMKDHNNSVDSVIGKVTEAFFDPKDSNIKFAAEFEDSAMEAKVGKGYVTNVSVGAGCTDLYEGIVNDQECLIAEGITFYELSLVGVPGDPNASITQALTESFNLKKLEESNGGNKMTEQTNESLKVAEEARILKEQNEKMSNQIKAFEAKELKGAQEKYKELCTEKTVSPRGDFESLTKEKLDLLIETLQSIKTPVASPAGNSTKGKIPGSEVEETIGMKYNIEYAESGKGFAISVKDAGAISPVYKR